MNKRYVKEHNEPYGWEIVDTIRTPHRTFATGLGDVAAQAVIDELNYINDVATAQRARSVRLEQSKGEASEYANSQSHETQQYQKRIAELEKQNELYRAEVKSLIGMEDKFIEKIQSARARVRELEHKLTQQTLTPVDDEEFEVPMAPSQLGKNERKAYEAFCKNLVSKYGICHWQVELAWMHQQERINALTATVEAQAHKLDNPCHSVVKRIATQLGWAPIDKHDAAELVALRSIVRSIELEMLEYEYHEGTDNLADALRRLKERVKTQAATIELLKQPKPDELTHTGAIYGQQFRTTECGMNAFKDLMNQRDRYFGALARIMKWNGPFTRQVMRSRCQASVAAEAIYDGYDNALANADD